uniref:FYVE-type domain-containing protein n=2 Tax=Nothobranchius rachovii TaxID=451742 RepID=A0A1A8QHA5_9TELE
MLKFFSARDDENESLLGEITEEEGDNPSLQDSKQHWLNRPCLLVLRDGDVAKPRLGCGQIRPESPSKATSGAAIRNTLKQCEQKASEHPTKTTPPSKLDENSCTMTAISTWRELESSSTLVPSPTEAAWPEGVEENEVEGKKPLDFPSKEDSVVEEKELEESRQEQQEHSCSSDATEAPASVLQQDLNTGAKMVRTSEGKEMSKVLTANEEGATKEGALPDNESQLCPTGILSKDQGSALGEVAPLWVPDAEAQVCMKCGIKFTFTKRRHHCRACGKVFCALCSNLKFKLTHLDGKEGRVCVSCHSTLVKRTPPGGRRKVWFADEILTNRCLQPDVNRKCWCVTTKGMHAVGQVEVVVLLQCLPEEKSFPKDIFSHFIQLYRDCLAGRVVKHLSLFQFGSRFLGGREHAGFMYVRSTLQSLQGLPLPNQPYLFGLLVNRAEVAWAKAFPLRLMLRLGAEYRFYPCPLYSVRFRKPLFGEIGHTIMRLLVDFRNYRYSLPMVPGLTVDLEALRTCIKIPTSGYNEFMKAMNKSNEHVLAIGASFNESADSHLICVQTEDGQYQTQAISIHNQPRKVTGSCFFIFSSALKASAGYLAKSSIVEDGLMVQVTVETMAEIRRSLREMKDYTVTCGRLDQSEGQELVCLQWVEEKCTVNKGVISPVDGRSMESVRSKKMFQKSEYKENGKIIRWTEVFFLPRGQNPNGGVTDTAEHNRLTERIARAFCLALCPHLKLLKEDGMAKLGLRVTFETQEVGFVAGSNGQPLPAQYLNALDSVLIPVIHSRGRKRGEEPVVMELIFYILENIT